MLVEIIFNFFHAGKLKNAKKQQICSKKCFLTLHQNAGWVFYSKLKMKISTSVWSKQHPNAVWNIQQLLLDISTVAPWYVICIIYLDSVVQGSNPADIGWFILNKKECTRKFEFVKYNLITVCPPYSSVLTKLPYLAQKFGK